MEQKRHGKKLRFCLITSIFVKTVKLHLLLHCVSAIIDHLETPLLKKVPFDVFGTAQAFAKT